SVNRRAAERNGGCRRPAQRAGRANPKSERADSTEQVYAAAACHAEAPRRRVSPCHSRSASTRLRLASARQAQRGGYSTKTLSRGGFSFHSKFILNQN